MAAAPAPGDGSALVASELTKRFSRDRAVRPALDAVSLSVAPAEIVCLAGPDGAGKTTLLRICAGLLLPTSGTVRVLGMDTARQHKKIQERIGYMPQRFGLYQDLTVAENLDLYSDLQGVARGDRRARYERLMRMTGLARFTDRLAGKLSGGMKQKLGLACALVKSPELLLLDEPTVGVDPVSRRELWRIIAELVRNDGVGVLVSTAYLDEAERCDRVLVMHEGRVLAHGTPEAFRAQMRGRTFALRGSRGARRIHAAIAGRSGVADATIRSGRVRVVLETEQPAPSFEALAGRVEVAPIEPSFEDAFMSILPHRQEASLGSAGRNVENGDAEADRQSNEVVVRVRNLTKRFGTFEAVRSLSFDVHRGEIFGLLGPNGAGKSTTFRMLCGLLTATGGELSVAGHDLRRSGATARSRLGYMAQQFSLYGWLTTLENLVFFGRAYGLGVQRLRERVEWALDEFSLRSRRDLRAAELPGGYKQRLAMATALLHEPDILFLDEPTSGVDPFARREFWRRISHFAETGVTVIVTTHFMEEAEYCDRMVMLVQGAALALGSPDEIRALVRSDQNPDPTVEDAFVALAEGGNLQDPGPAAGASA